MRWPTVERVVTDRRGQISLVLACGHVAQPNLTEQHRKNPDYLLGRRYPCPEGCVEEPEAA